MTGDSYKVFDNSSTGGDSSGSIFFHGYSFRKRELVLGGVTLIALITVVVLAACLATANQGKESSTKPSVNKPDSQTGVHGNNQTNCADNSQNTEVQGCLCFNSMCMKSAANVLDSLNSTADLCMDFYEYACGHWAKEHMLPPNLFQNTPFSIIYSENQDKIQKLIDSPIQRKDAQSSEKKLKDFFRSCTDDYGKMVARGNPFLNNIVSMVGGWYVLGSLDENKYDYQLAIRKTRVDFWTNAFFGFNVRTDLVDWRKRVIQIDLSGLGMSVSYYINPKQEKVRNHYKDFMRTVAELLIRDSNVTLDKQTQTERIQTFIDDTWYIEHQLANITWNSIPHYGAHKLENRMSLTELNNMTNKAIDWVNFFTYMFKEAKVTADTKVVVLKKQYLIKMTQMIDSLPAQNKSRMINDYLIWRLAQKYVQDLSWDYIHSNRDFYVDVTGNPAFLGAWRYCFNTVNRDMGEALSSLYIRDHFVDKNKIKAHEIVDHLRDTLIDDVMKNTWMEAATKNTARTKLKTALYKLGYPKYMLNATQLDRIYINLEINKKDYFGNLLSLNKFYKEHWNRRLLEGTNKAEWAYRTFDVLAEFYNPWNELIVPAGLLQLPLYDYRLPHFMNFGSIGTLIGHRLIHAVDEFGMLYKIDGSWWGHWWTNKTKANYKSVKKCVIDAYQDVKQGPFKISRGQPRIVALNSVRYAPEALAESSGIRLAYRAYKRWEKAQSTELTAPGLNKTNEQMFFIAYAQANCFNRRDYYAYSQAYNNVIQENLKVNMALTQVEEFRKAFSCPSGSKMVADKICKMY